MTETKRCGTCKQAKPVDQFAVNKTKPDGRNGMCRPCKKDYNATYYERTKEVHNPSRFERNRKARRDATAFVIAYLREHPCIDCGETDIVVLDFDHQRDKYKDINRMVKGGHPIWKIAAEIAKCEVVCANDHRRRTAKTQSWLRAVQPASSAASSSGRASDS